jgi:hypothetical protein
MPATNALLVLYDPRGGITDAGERGPLWSSDCRPAPTLKALPGELLMAGWPLSEMLKLPGEDEPERFSDVYKREFGKLPKNFAAFQCEAQVQKHMQDNAGGAYGIVIPGAGKYGRSDYGGNLKMIYRLDELAELLGVSRRAIVDAERRSPHGLLSWTPLHGGYACHEALLPDLKRALRR